MRMTFAPKSAEAPEPREPRYRQVKQQLTEALRQGRWKHGQKIPSEPLLARRHGVSVATIRRAVGELVAENILQREQGRGTFVRSHTRDYMLNAFFRIVGRDGSKELPATTLLGMKRSRADAETARRLRLKPRGAVLEIETLLTLGGAPAILDRMHVPAALFPDFGESAFARRGGTVYGFFQERYGITVVRAEEFITAVNAAPREAALLGVRPGTALLRIVRTAYTYKDLPVDTRVRLVACGRHGYLSRLGTG